MTELAHGGPVCQDSTVLFILPERIDDFIELCSEVIGFQAVPEIKEGGIESSAIAAKVGPEVSDETGLHTDLLTLGVAVGLFRLGHRSERQFHYLSSLRFSCRRSCSMNAS